MEISATKISLTSTVTIDSIDFASYNNNFNFMASLQAPHYQAEKRSPLDLVCIVDKSGSMAGAKLNLVKDTLVFVLTQLTDKDRLGVVSYDDNVDVDLQLTFMDTLGKNYAEGAIKRIAVNGSTNLCGGLVKGLELMRQRTIKNEVASVLLFTDGLANVGYQSLTDIIRAMDDPLFGSSNASSMRASPQITNRLQKQMPNMQYPPMQLQMQQQMPNMQYPPMQQQQMPNMQYPPMQQQQMSNMQYPPMQQQQQMPNMQYPPMQQQQLQQLTQQQQQLLQMQQQQMAQMQYPSLTQQQVVTPVTNTVTPTPAVTGNVPLPCTVYTFGFGSDHDPNLLKGIAEHGSGVYYFIQNNDDIPESFADCLGGLLSVAAQNISLKFEALNGVQINNVLSKFKVTSHSSTNYEVTIGDIQSDEKKDIIVSAKIPSLPSAVEKFEIAKVSLDYFDVISGKIESDSLVVYISRPASPVNVQANVDLDKQNNRWIAAEAMEKATQAGNSGNLTLGRQLLQSAMEKIQGSISASDPFCESLVVDLKKCEEKMRTNHEFQSVGQQMLNNNYNAHYMQRSSNVKMASQQVYQTASRNMQQQQQQQIFSPYKKY